MLRHADAAVQAAQQSRLSGQVSIGLAPTTAAVLGLPLMLAMRERYPEVRLHLVEALSGHLTAMLNSRQIDLAIVCSRPTPRAAGACCRCWTSGCSSSAWRRLPGMPTRTPVRLEAPGRAAADAAVGAAWPARHDRRRIRRAPACEPNVVAEIEAWRC